MKRKRRTQVFPPVPRIFEPSEKKKKKTFDKNKKNKTKKKSQKIQTNKKKNKLLISFQLFGLFIFFPFFFIYISERENAGETFLTKSVETIYFIR